MIRDRLRKSTKRAKKLGINANDFLIWLYFLLI
jgi:hypothetical protein